MSVVRRHLGAGAVSPNKLDSHLRPAAFGDQGAYLRYVAGIDPVPITLDIDGFTIPPAATTDGLTSLVNFGGVSGGTAVLAYFGDATIYGPRLTEFSKGLQLDLDNAGEGCQYDFGDAINGLGVAYMVSSDVKAGYFIRAKLRLADVSDMITCAVGYRGAEAIAAFSNYVDIAVLNVDAGDVKITTVNNGAAAVVTDTGVNVADNGIVELKVVFKDGFFRFYVDGVEYEPRTAPEASLRLYPFIFISKTAGTGFVYLQELEVGPLAAVDDIEANIL